MVSEYRHGCGRSRRTIAFCWYEWSITIRDVPDDTRDELAARAARSGRSLQEYLRAELVELARRPDSETLVARIRERKLRTGSQLSTEAILRYRDADRK